MELLSYREGGVGSYVTPADTESNNIWRLVVSTATRSVRFLWRGNTSAAPVSSSCAPCAIAAPLHAARVRAAAAARRRGGMGAGDRRLRGCLDATVGGCRRHVEAMDSTTEPSQPLTSHLLCLVAGWTLNRHARGEAGSRPRCSLRRSTRPPALFNKMARPQKCETHHRTTCPSRSRPRRPTIPRTPFFHQVDRDTHE